MSKMKEEFIKAEEKSKDSSIVLRNRIDEALKIAFKDGQTEGSHHKLWVIDQMIRALTGCPVIYADGISHDGVKIAYHRQGESKEYLEFIKEYRQGGEYNWDEGISP